MFGLRVFPVLSAWRANARAPSPQWDRMTWRKEGLGVEQGCSLVAARKEGEKDIEREG